MRNRREVRESPDSVRDHWSVRTYLFVLAAAVALPLTTLLALNIYRTIQHDAEQASAAALGVVEIVAASVNTFVQDGRETLSRLVLRPQIRAMDPARCDPILENFLDLNPEFANVGVVNLSGQVICSALPQSGNDYASIANMEHFQRLLREDRFVVGKPFVGPITGKWVAALAYPVHDERGKLTGMVGLPIDLERYVRFLKTATLPSDAIVSIINGDGTIIAHSVEAEQWSGKNVRNSEIIGIVLAGRQGYAAAAGFDGTRRLYGFTPVPDTDWLVLAGIPEAAVFAKLRGSILQDSFWGVTVVLSVIGLAFFIGRRMEQPVRAMAATAKEVAQGQLAARATVSGPREIAEVAAEFNRMLDFRDQVELALRETERRFRNLLENVQMVAVILDLEGRIRFCNDYLLALTGWTREELLGKDWFTNLIPPADAHVREVFLQALIRGEIVAHYENPIVTRAGELRMMRWTNTLLKDPDGNVAGVASLGEDITERLSSERRAAGEKQILEMAAKGAALEEILEALCRNIEEQCRRGALCTVLLLDTDGVHLRHGAAPGLPQSFVRAIDGSAIGPTAGSCGTAAFLRKAIIVTDIASDPLWGDYRELALAHGLRACWSTPIFSDRSSVLGTFAIYYPQPLAPTSRELHLTESASYLAGIVIIRHRAELALRNSEERYRHIVETAQEGIWVIDADDKTTFVNRRMAEMLGYGTAEMSNAPLSRFMDEEGRRISDANAARRHSGIQEQHEFKFLRSDGSPLWALLSTTPRFDDSGHYAGALAMVADITERKRAENRITRLNRLYSVLSKTNEAIMRVRDPQELYERICRIAVEDGFLRMTWVGLLDEETQRIRPIAHAGNEQGYLQEINISLRLTAESRGPTARAVMEGNCNICNDWEQDPRMAPWRQAGARRGYRSSGAFPIKAGPRVVGTINFYSGEKNFFTDEEQHLLDALAADIGYAIQAFEAEVLRRQAEEALKDANSRLRALSSRVLEVQEAERSRIARELHDEIGQVLTALKIHLQKLKPESEPQSLERGIADCVDITGHALNQVRNLTIDLRPPQLDYLGLGDAIRWNLERQCATAGITGHFVCDPRFPRLRPDLETTCFRIAQEALTNVVRHANAHEVLVELLQQDDELHLRIRDNGRGFDVEDVTTLSIQDDHMGVLGMRERATLAGGRLEIQSSPSHGTEVHAVLPLQLSPEDTALQKAGK